MMLSIQKSSLSSAGARRLVEAATRYAHENGLAIAVAAVDLAGAPIALLRMDGVSASVSEFALDKAYTSANSGLTTQEFFAHMASEPSLLAGLSNRSRLLVWGGGLPVKDKGVLVGGLGVSGAREADDIACARHALEAVGAL
jgi:uncharacterized protein GlcG (DUF336 family)